MKAVASEPKVVVIDGQKVELHYNPIRRIWLSDVADARRISRRIKEDYEHPRKWGMSSFFGKGGDREAHKKIEKKKQRAAKKKVSRA